MPSHAAMKEAPWLAPALARLEAVFDRLPHGLLVQGPGGWGEELVASVLVRRLLGIAEHRSPREVAHPDLRWLQPDAGVLKVDQIRAVIGFLHQTPSQAPCKVAVVASADAMNANAANALLKSLEEPPPNSYAVLVTGSVERLLPTVRSRCQRIEVHAAGRDVVRRWLSDNGHEGERVLQLCVEYGNAPFAVRDALARDESPLSPLLAEVGRDPSAALSAATQCGDGDLAQVVTRWLRIVHQFVREHPSGAAGLLQFAEELVRIRALALENTGLNRTMQLERLFLLWGQSVSTSPVARGARGGRPR